MKYSKKILFLADLVSIPLMVGADLQNFVKYNNRTINKFKRKDQNTQQEEVPKQQMEEEIKRMSLAIKMLGFF